MRIAIMTLLWTVLAAGLPGVPEAVAQAPRDFCDLSGFWVGKNVRGNVSLRKTHEQTTGGAPVRAYRGTWNGAAVDVRHEYVPRDIEEAGAEYRGDVVRVFEKRPSSAPAVRSDDLTVRTLWVGADCGHFRLVEEISNLGPARRWKFDDPRAPVFRRARSGAEIPRPGPSAPVPEPVRRLPQPGWKPGR